MADPKQARRGTYSQESPPTKPRPVPPKKTRTEEITPENLVKMFWKAKAEKAEAKVEWLRKCLGDTAFEAIIRDMPALNKADTK